MKSRAKYLLQVVDYQFFNTIVKDAVLPFNNSKNLFTSAKIYFFMWPQFVI